MQLPQPIFFTQLQHYFSRGLRRAYVKARPPNALYNRGGGLEEASRGCACSFCACHGGGARQRQGIQPPGPQLSEGRWVRPWPPDSEEGRSRGGQHNDKALVLAAGEAGGARADGSQSGYLPGGECWGDVGQGEIRSSPLSATGLLKGGEAGPWRIRSSGGWTRPRQPVGGRRLEGLGGASAVGGGWGSAGRGR
ncbi:hypothetical protein D1007_09609 [Hordeum vulgare]|nr:hypothetical protein D1007_09609 [Hordeum vulgare]